MFDRFGSALGRDASALRRRAAVWPQDPPPPDKALRQLERPLPRHPAIPEPERDRIYRLYAGEDVADLGWAPEDVPPGRVVVGDVFARSWAEEVGVEVGDELLAINGEDATAMDGQALLSVRGPR